MINDQIDIHSVCKIDKLQLVPYEKLKLISENSNLDVINNQYALCEKTFNHINFNFPDDNIINIILLKLKYILSLFDPSVLVYVVLDNYWYIFNHYVYNLMILHPYPCGISVLMCIAGYYYILKIIALKVV
jgi:hypothetical protein